MLAIAEAPDQLSDHSESSPKGFQLEAHLCHGFVVKYWIDFADRHVKVLELEQAD